MEAFTLNASPSASVASKSTSGCACECQDRMTILLVRLTSLKLRVECICLHCMKAALAVTALMSTPLQLNSHIAGLRTAHTSKEQLTQ